MTSPSELTRGCRIRGRAGVVERPLSTEFVQGFVLCRWASSWPFVSRKGFDYPRQTPRGACTTWPFAIAQVADAIAVGLERIDRRLILVGLAGSELLAAGTASGWQWPPKDLLIGATNLTDNLSPATGRAL